MKRIKDSLLELSTLAKLPTPMISVDVKKNVHRMVLNNMYALLETKYCYAPVGDEDMFKPPFVVNLNKPLSKQYLFDITRFELFVKAMTQPVEAFIKTYKSQYSAKGNIVDVKALNEINYNSGLVKWVNTYTLAILYKMSDDELNLIIFSILLSKPSMIDFCMVDAIYAPRAIKVVSITYEMFIAIEGYLEYRGWNPLNSTELLNSKLAKGLK